MKAHLMLLLLTAVTLHAAVPAKDDAGRWGLGRRMPKCLEYLSRYGTHAKELLPQLREIRKTFGKPDENAAMLDQTIKTIENSTKTPPLIGLEDFRISHKSAP